MLEVLLYVFSTALGEETPMKMLMIGMSACLLVSCADFEQNVGEAIKVAQNAQGAGSGSIAPSSSESVSATKQALEKGVNVGINLLQKDGGFLNSIHHIVIPTELQKATNLARSAGLGSYVDGFEKSLNGAAETAMTSAVPIFKDAITQLTFNDVVKILTGPDNAATSFFKTTSEKKLVDTFKPIVAKATQKNNVGKLYTQMLTAVRPAALVAGVPIPAVNLDEYVSGKAVDALFIEIASQEKKIRENPVERTTAILQKVFSFYGTRAAAAPASRSAR